MKIAVVTSPFLELPPDAIGAIERRWFNTVAEFVAQGHGTQLVGKRGRTVLPDEAGIRRTYVRGYRRTFSIFGDILLDFLYSFRAPMATEKTDVLVCNTFWSPVIAPIFFRGRYRALVYNVARFPKGHMRLYRGVDCFACTSAPVMAELVRRFPSFAKKSVVVSNPIDTEVFRAGGDAPAGGLLVGYHGRINREKGLDILCRAVALLRGRGVDARLRMIGTWDTARGGSGEWYKEELDAVSGGCIEWCGAVSDPKELAARLRECAAYCYPSVAEKGETFGVSPLEAMGLGLPTVVSALSCFTDFAKDGENALVFDHRADDAVERLAEKLQIALTDCDLRRRVSRAAAATAGKFSVAAIAERYLELFGQLLSEDRRQ